MNAIYWFEYSKKRKYSDELLFLSSMLNYVLTLPITFRTFQITGVELTETCCNQFQKLFCNSKCSIESLRLVECSDTLLFLEILIPIISASAPKSLQHSPVRQVMVKLFQSLAHSTNPEKLFLESSDAEDHSISEEIVCSLQISIKENKHLKVLTINPCPADILCHLREGLLQKCLLQSLDLADNILTDSEQTKSVKLILCKYSTLLTLDLSNCLFTEAGINDIASGIMSNTKLTCLRLDCLKILCSSSSIPLPPKMWHSLFNSLKRHVSIHTLSVCKNELDFEALEELIRCNKVIRTVKCDDCGFSET